MELNNTDGDCCFLKCDSVYLCGYLLKLLIFVTPLLQDYNKLQGVTYHKIINIPPQPHGKVNSDLLKGRFTENYWRLSSCTNSDTNDAS
jgi:hypothetical protein